MKHYPSAWSCARDVVREEGVRGLFRGVTIPVVTITFVRTSSFSIYTGTKAWLEAHVHSNKDHELWRTGLYGALGGVTSGTLISCGSAPFELVKVQRQLEFLIASQRQQRDSPGAPKVPFKPQTGFQAAADIVRNHGGVRGFYMGFPLHITRDMIGTALYFGIYDTIRAVGDRMEARNQTLGLPRPVLSFLIGSSAGMLSWLLVYPVDLIKTQVQRNALAGSPKTSARAVFRKLLYEQGPAGTNASASRWTLGGIPVNRFLRLYRGLGISAVRSFISHGITWMLIESISRRLRESAKDQDTRTPPFDYLDFQ